VPAHSISNFDCSQVGSPSEIERLVRNIGIEKRRICKQGQCFSDLAFSASLQLLNSLQWNPSDIDALIVVSQSPDYLVPSTAIILQDRLGLKKETIAFDVNLGCSGYPYGLYLLSTMISTGSIKRGLLLVGDKTENIYNPLFSDAGTATALEFDVNSPPIFFDLNSDGSGYKAIIKNVGGHREPFGPQHFTGVQDDSGVLSTPNEIQLDGPAILSFSTNQIPKSVDKILEYSNIDKNDIDYFVFHQANKIINETIRKKLRLTEEKTPSTLWKFGNSSGASIPLTITDQLRDKISGESANILMSGFGVGLSWATCILNVNNVILPPLLEL
jgi:3-oxoacyl-[acyl-carrier-protein] synthase-3